MYRKLLLILVVVLIAAVSARADIMRFESDFTDWTGQDGTSQSPVSSSTGHTPGSDWSVTVDSMGGAVDWLTQGDIDGTPTTASFYYPGSGTRGRFLIDLPADWVSNGLQDTGLRVDYGMNYADGYNSRRGSIQICFPTIHGPFDAYIRVQNHLPTSPHTMIRPLNNGGGSYNVDTLYLEDGDGNPRYIADEWHDWTVVVAYAYEDGSDWAYWDLFLDGEQLLFGGLDGSPVLDGHTWSFRTPLDERGSYMALGELDFGTPGWDFDCDYVNFANTPEPAPVASDPDPDDEEEDVDREVTLSWTPGVFADKHDVYFGDNYNDVSDANRTNHPAGVVVSENQDANSYSVPELLDYGTTYYWKISEVNDPPTTIFEGKVWEFTTELFAYPITPITATASSEITGKEAINTINESGLTDDLHSIDMPAMWLSDDEPTGAVIQYEFDKVYKLYEMWVWNYNGSDLNTILGFKDVTIEYSANGTDYTTLGTTHEFAIANGEPNYVSNTTIDFGGAVAKYVKLTATSNWSNGWTTQYGLSEVRFYRIPVRASRPEPTSGSTVANVDGVQLKWRAGREAASHDVYLSDSTPPAYAGNVTVTNYPTGTLELGKTYYWQINEVNLAEVPDTWEGPVWNFSTPTYLNVEDMESYTDWASIRKVWKDGYAYSRWENKVPVWAPNGSNVNTSTDHPSGPGPKMGTQAMAYNYDNDGNTAVPGYEAWEYDANYFSEATAQTAGPNSLGFGTDWTKADVRILSLQFYGDPGNDANDTEKLYVKLNDSRVEYDGDMSDIQGASWHEWVIDLNEFGINLSNVTSMSIGFGDETNINPGGDGVVYFDNIQLLPAGCHPSRLKPLADLDNDCDVDYQDLDLIASNWLISDYNVTPEAPDDVNLVGWWKFEEASGTLDDQSDFGNVGTYNGELYQQAGEDGYALGFDGVDDVVSVGTNGRPSDTFSFGGWLKTSVTHEIDPESTTGAAGVDGQRYAFVPEHGGDFNAGAGLSVGTNGISVYEHGGGYMPATAVFAVYAADIGDDWNHIMVVYNNKQPTIYLNGQTVRTGLTSPRAMVNAPIQFGGMAYGYFAGLMDDVRIYNRALSQSEVASLAGKSAEFTQPLYLLLTPPNPYINMYDDGTIDFKDYAVLADGWLEEKLWPEW